MVQVEELFFLPPLAIARLGGSDTPLECFHWAPSPDPRGAGRTVLEPSLTFAMAADGTLSPYVPTNIRFRDHGKLRPVAPFFELWVRVRTSADEPAAEVPLTSELLRSLGLSHADLRFEISVANKKAQRRTGETACGFMARVTARGDDHERKPLLASSPHDAAHVPLVSHDRPIPLGSFQVARPVEGDADAVLKTIRVRFTPAKGEVYGPPNAVAAVASPLPEGQNLVWGRQMRGRLHEIVKPENRILNPDSAWSRYTAEAPGQFDPQPSDSYDGAKNGDQLSWGVVDDTCDGVIQASLVVAGTRFRAFARVTSSPPDFAPDRRMFVSVADDLADRDMPDVPVGDGADLRAAAEDEVVDLLARVFETASQINLDAERHHYMCRRGERPDEPPRTDGRSMTPEDQPFARRSATGVIDASRAGARADLPSSDLQYTKMAEEMHEALMQRIPLLSFLAGDPDRVRKLIRPPFGRLHQLASDMSSRPPLGPFRDPRVERDTRHDMRMPPYMLDSDANPLSLTVRQYRLLMALVDQLSADAAPASPPPPPGLREAASTRIRKVRKVARPMGDGSKSR